MSELIVLLERREVGVVRHERGRLTFAYDESWRNARGAYPLSLSMPLSSPEHKHGAIEPFLWGLLPDNELVLERWAKRFQVSARSAFALISHVGEDCAGAVQFVRPERRDELLSDTSAAVEWLTESEVADRMRALQRDASASRTPSDAGQFSLAGAQPKTALLFDGSRWGVPSGREPTTHILKPPTNLDGHVENEQLCLMLARSLGLPTARSEIRHFDDVIAIVVERYDRVRIADLAAARASLAATKAAEAAMHAASSEPDAVVHAASAAAAAAEASAAAQALAELGKHTHTYRVHQEDFCQALRAHLSRKYQNEGGPGPRQIVDLLRTHAAGARRSLERGEPMAHEEDIATFLDALILNWLIGGTDAHAKNYSILIGGGGLVRLAPLYDIASIFAYPEEINASKAKLAMKIGNTYRLRDIGLSAWRKLASELRADPDALVDRARAMAAELPDRLSAEVLRLRQAGMTHAVIDNLANALPERATLVARM